MQIANDFIFRKNQNQSFFFFRFKLRGIKFINLIFG